MQKPTARIFYDKCIIANPELAKFEAETLRQKMKNFRSSYSKANDWRNSTGAGLPDDDSGTSIIGINPFKLLRTSTWIDCPFFILFTADHLHKMCPYWNILDEIFSQKTSLNPVAIYESGQSNMKDEENDAELIISDDMEIDFSISNHESSFDASNSNDIPEAVGFDQLIAPRSSQNIGEDNATQMSFQNQLPRTTRGSQMNPNHVLLEIAKMRNATSEKKLQLEVKKLELEEKRSEREYEIKKMEAEARKLEAENLKLQLTLALSQK